MERSNISVEDDDGLASAAVADGREVDIRGSGLDALRFEVARGKGAAMLRGICTTNNLLNLDAINMFTQLRAVAEKLHPAHQWPPLSVHGDGFCVSLS